MKFGPATEQGAEFDKSITSIIVTDRIATVFVRNRGGQVVFRDTLTLLRLEGRWRIVHKAFEPEPVAPAP